MKRAAFLVLFLAACGAASVPPSPAGSLRMSLTQAGLTTGVSGGAIVLTISGGTVGAVHAASGFDVVSTTDGRGTHVILIGPLALGQFATFDVPDTSKASAYVAAVDQVADGSTFALLDARNFKVGLGVVK